MTGIVKHTRAARGLIILGFILSLFFFILSIIFLLLKLIFWDLFEFGLAPLMIGLFLIGFIFGPKGKRTEAGKDFLKSEFTPLLNLVLWVAILIAIIGAIGVIN